MPYKNSCTRSLGPQQLVMFQASTLIATMNPFTVIVIFDYHRWGSDSCFAFLVNNSDTRNAYLMPSKDTTYF